MTKTLPPAVVWFRRDLRLVDNPALAQALSTGRSVLLLFVQDEAGEGDWPDGGASRWWLHHALAALQADALGLGARLVVRRGPSLASLLEICRESGATEVYWNRRYEPAIVARDTEVKKGLLAAGVQGRSFNGSLLHSPLQVTSKAGTPFKVFTPFWKTLREMPQRGVVAAPIRLPGWSGKVASLSVEELELLPRIAWDAGFRAEWQPGEAGAAAALERFAREGAANYSAARDFPAERGVSRLSPYLHFGELSPTQIWHRLAGEGFEPYRRQLAWREFAHHLLFHFPTTPTEPLRPEFAAFPWKRDGELLEAWRRGRTGFPIVDAGMRELWTTGWMHNRVRMIAASLLVKHLLQPWQEGAAWFWDTLVDADLANNTLGWQWVAGCGADAAPYFRIFNPIAQGERFDSTGAYTRRWVPELARLPDEWLFKPWEAPAVVLAKAGVRLGESYPLPVVSHEAGRQRALDAYKQLRSG